MHSRLLIVERVLERGWTVAAAAEAAGVSERTAAKWLARYRSEGSAGLVDRSSAPRRVARRTPPECDIVLRTCIVCPPEPTVPGTGTRPGGHVPVPSGGCAS
ncbi:MAG TPA: leucine zipper domain-containing protein [Gaiellaceae bacterium]